MRNKSKQPMTAAELMRKLQKDQEFQRKKAKRKKEFDDKKVLLQKEEGSVVSDLLNVGIQVRTVWDLVNMNSPYPKAIPVLVKHLQMSYSEKIREGIARALAVTEAKDYWSILLKEFLKDTDKKAFGSKFGLACALSVIAKATKRHKEVIDIMKDTSHGQNRAAFIDVFSTKNDPELLKILEEFVDDPEIGGDVRWALKHPGRQRR